MIACFLSNISAKYYKNPSMLSRVIAKNVGDVFFETQCSDRTETVSGLVPDRNKVDSVRSRNIFCSGAEPCEAFPPGIYRIIVLFLRFNGSSLFTLQPPFNVTYANASNSIIADK